MVQGLFDFDHEKSEDEEKKKLLNSSSKNELVSFRNSPSRVIELDQSPSRFATRSPWTNMSTTCEASEDEMR